MNRRKWLIGSLAALGSVVATRVSGQDQEPPSVPEPELPYCDAGLLKPRPSLIPRYVVTPGEELYRNERSYVGWVKESAIKISFPAGENVTFKQRSVDVILVVDAWT